MDSYKGGGGARRINVVYFLSRGGRSDHPHLFSVNLSHLYRAGVRLRDVKRWLSEVRGKDMPDNFSWSYKRKYKAGYVWQDLLDDDLITPISDNEYVLKGCDVRRTPPCADAPKRSSSDEKKLNKKGDREQKQAEEELRVQVTRDYDDSSPKPPPPIAQDSPVGDAEPARRAAPFTIVLPQDLQQRKQRRQREAAVSNTASEQQALVVARAGAAGGEKQQRPAVGRAPRMRVAQVLHSILTCGAADAVDDAALRPVLPRQSAGAIDMDDEDGWQRTPGCPGMDGCGISMSRKVKLQQRGGKDSKAKRDGGPRRDRVAAAHKPATLPRCSQCGKGFKPQDLHSHMQSCRGLRERMRRSSAAGARVSVDRSRSSTAMADDYSSTERSHAVFLLTES